MSGAFGQAFFLTMGGCGLVLAAAALVLALGHLRGRSAGRIEALRQSEREKLLHMENIALRRRLHWVESRLPAAPGPAFAPDAPTVKQAAMTAGRHE